MFYLFNIINNTSRHCHFHPSCPHPLPLQTQVLTNLKMWIENHHYPKKRMMKTLPSLTSLISLICSSWFLLCFQQPLCPSSCCLSCPDVYHWSLLVVILFDL